jgi:hypothetical protein
MSWSAIHLRSGEVDAASDGVFLCPLFGITTVALASDQALFSRFVAPRTMTVDTIRFRVQVADAADTPVDVGIYDGDSGVLLGSSGAVLGFLNSGAIKEVPLTAPVQLEGGKVYYSAIAPDAIAAAPTIQGTSISNAGFGVFMGPNAPDVLGGTMAAAHPLPATAVIVGAGSTGLPILFGIET